MAGPFDNIMSIFRTPAPTPPAAAPTPNPNPNANGQPIPGVDPNNPTLPAGQGNPPVNQNPQNPDPQDPFKAFQGMWDIDPTLLTPESPIFANLDPAKVMESARKANFAAVSQEQAAAIQAGGPEALKAMQQILNTAAQNVYGQSALATANMVNKAIEAANARMEGKLPSLMTKHQVATTLQQDNPIFANPQLAPIVQGLSEQFRVKFPTATPEEIKQQVSAYMNAVGATFAPKPPVDPRAPKPDNTDWLGYMGESSQ